MFLRLFHLFLFLPLTSSGILAFPTNERRQIIDLPDLGIPLVDDLLSLDLLDDIIDGIDKHPEVDTAFPGLKGLLGRLKDDDLDPESYVRGLLLSIQQHDAFKEAFGELDKDLQDKVSQFLKGDSARKIIGKRDFYIPPSPAALHHFKRMEEAGKTLTSRAWLNAKRQTSPVIYEDEAQTKVMKAYVDAPFENWGLTVSNKPAFTFVPTTVHGVENLVKWAKANNKRVRGGGYRHTWTNMYSEDNEILVSVLDLEIATAVPDPSSLLPNYPHEGNELKVIELANEDVPGSNGKKRLLKLGAAVTNEELRRWAVQNDAWTMPMNVIMVEITLGGSNIPICHGAGIRHKTISDIVRAISYVDANGKAQTIDNSNPELLKAAAGSFGLLGIVTHVTLEVDKMTYAVMKPRKDDAMLGIPPPPGYVVPAPLRKLYLPAQLEAARERFVEEATSRYYSEWFWFPYQKEIFVNVWDNTESRDGVADYPSPPDVFLQWVQGWLGGVINDCFLWRQLPGLWQGAILGFLAHTAQPPQGPLNQEIRTHLTNALHFRRGVQNMRVRDMELQIPIPPLASDPTKPDYTVVQKAWWDAIIETYEDPKAPMRIALEMRIMGDSDLILAPQKGNKFGTASIEVLTTMPAVADGSWGPYVQRVADKWMALTDGKGVRLNTRPHWSKEWDGMTVDGMSWKQYLKTVSYKDEIPEFKSTLENIGQLQGWTLADAKQRFSCSLLDYIFFD